MTYITPYLPKIGEMAAQAWLNQNKPCFIKAYHRHEGECPNCQGMGIVFLIRCDGGPYRSPSMKACTWFDGNGQFGKGWYTFTPADLLAYECPKCKNQPKPEGEYVMSPEPGITRLAERLRV